MEERLLKESSNFWISKTYSNFIYNLIEKMRFHLKQTKKVDIDFFDKVLDLIDEKIKNNDIFDINNFILNEINNSKVMDVIQKKFISEINSYIELYLERIKKVCIKTDKWHDDYDEAYKKYMAKDIEELKKIAKNLKINKLNIYNNENKLELFKRIYENEQLIKHQSPKKSPKVKSPKKSSKVKSPKKSSKMNEINFSKYELLKDLTILIDIKKYPISIKLYNENVKILLIIESSTDIILYGFYKHKNETRQGVVRCALYFLLEFLLEKNLITNKHICSVSSPTPTDCDLERLIKIYNQIGFILYEPEPGKPINLKASINLLISTLEKQCMDSNYIKKDNYYDYKYYNKNLYNKKS